MHSAEKCKDSCTRGQAGDASAVAQPSRPATGASPAQATARLVVTRPTVVAYFVLAPDAVGTVPDLAVAADDWGYAMATKRRP